MWTPPSESPPPGDPDQDDFESQDREVCGHVREVCGHVREVCARVRANLGPHLSPIAPLPPRNGAPPPPVVNHWETI